MRRRRVSLGRVLAYVLAIVLSAWIIFPIYLITISAFSSFDAVYVYPRQLLPRDVSTDTIRLFLESDGIIDSLKRSIYVAAITIVACLAIGTPAGYALARFSFRGANPFQLALVSTRAFPLIIIAVPLAVTYLRIGIDDTVYGPRGGARRLHAAAHGAHHGERVRGNLVRAGGGGDDARLQPAVRDLAGRAPACAWRNCRSGHLHLRDVVERGVRGCDPHLHATARCPRRCSRRSMRRRCRTASPAASSCWRPRWSSSSSSASTS